MGDDVMDGGVERFSVGVQLVVDVAEVRAHPAQLVDDFLGRLVMGGLADRLQLLDALVERVPDVLVRVRDGGVEHRQSVGEVRVGLAGHHPPFRRNE
ncbi:MULTISPECIES: hypothetical protein [Streptomyces]|uniref:Uncharacterized protein n=1 Tax=Streptomyces demainii TaxID=588122 RepID=A0ABT9KWD6_9ACTN|nr:hypothetical protein [Streptomyces demainii]MDP9612768.1 hypothetical protein [Streptomyces demainii]